MKRYSATHLGRLARCTGFYASPLICSSKHIALPSWFAGVVVLKGKVTMTIKLRAGASVLNILAAWARSLNSDFKFSFPSCHRVSLDDDGTDPGFLPLMFRAHSRAGSLQERRQTQAMIPMKSLHRGEKALSFSHRRSHTSWEEHAGWGRRDVIRPKPLFYAVDEEYESGEQTEEETSATRSRWIAEHRHSREHYKSHSPLLHRK